MKPAGRIVTKTIVETLPERVISHHLAVKKADTHQLSGQQAEPDAEEQGFSVSGAELPLG
jgi:hypothetical protein